MSELKVKFWGTRGSIATPGPGTVKYGGNTSCVELRAGGQIFILDAGTGIRPLGNALLAEFKGKPIEAKIFISHSHWDHIQGFPFFVPAYIPGNKFTIHSVHSLGRGFKDALKGQMDKTYFPVELGDMLGALDFVEVREPLDYDGVRITSTFTNHPGVDLSYRFEFNGKSAIYLTDHEKYEAMNDSTDFAKRQDQIIIDFCKDADILVCDSQYTDEDYIRKRTWGHSRFKDTVQLGLDAGVKNLFLFHHDPDYDDAKLDQQEAAAKEMAGGRMNVNLAREGASFEL